MSCVRVIMIVVDACSTSNNKVVHDLGCTEPGGTRGTLRSGRRITSFVSGFTFSGTKSYPALPARLPLLRSPADPQARIMRPSGVRALVCVLTVATLGLRAAILQPHQRREVHAPPLAFGTVDRTGCEALSLRRW